MIKLIVIFLIIIILYYIYIDSHYVKQYKKIIYESFDLQSEEENIINEENNTIKNYENSDDFNLYYYNYQKRKYHLYDDILKQNIINSIKIKKNHKIVLFDNNNGVSEIIYKQAKNLKYINIFILKNGIDGWTKSKYHLFDGFIKINTYDNKLIFFEYDKYRNILIQDNVNNNIGYIIKNKGKILIQKNYKDYIEYIFLSLIISIYG